MSKEKIPVVVQRRTWFSAVCAALLSFWSAFFIKHWIQSPVFPLTFFQLWLPSHFAVSVFSIPASVFSLLSGPFRYFLSRSGLSVTEHLFNQFKVVFFSFLTAIRTSIVFFPYLTSRFGRNRAAFSVPSKLSSFGIGSPLLILRFTQYPFDFQPINSWLI